ncbi:hypothetical protein [Streptomyces microflavus]
MSAEPEPERATWPTRLRQAERATWPRLRQFLTRILASLRQAR